MDDGHWPGTWRTTRGRARDGWRDGWDRDARCPPDPGKRGGKPARSGGWSVGDRWEDLHRRRVQVVRSLRRAGYVARHRWTPTGDPVRGFRGPSYVDGPVEGLPAVDPWDRAEALLRCSKSWYASLYQGGATGLAALEVPERCRRNHVCPVCAAAEAARRAAAVRAVVALGMDGGEALALVTLTQRAHPEESLEAALRRWRRGWSLALGRGGRVRRRREALLAGYYYGVEVTRGASGKGRRAGKWWHVHGHALVSLVDADDQDARTWMADRWRKSSAKAALEAGLEGFGWDPVAGGVGDGVTLEGEWWVPVDRDDPVQVYQAAKYPTPAADLHPVPLAEFLAVAYRRQWHQAGGSLYGVLSLAEGLEVEAEEVPEELRRPDLGERVSTDRPGTSPDPSTTDAPWTWEVRGGVDPLALREALLDLGGGIEVDQAGTVSAVLPASAGRALARRTSQAVRAWRLVADSMRRTDLEQGLARIARELLEADLAPLPGGRKVPT